MAPRCQGSVNTEHFWPVEKTRGGSLVVDDPGAVSAVLGRKGSMECMIELRVCRLFCQQGLSSLRPVPLLGAYY